MPNRNLIVLAATLLAVLAAHAPAFAASSSSSAYAGVGGSVQRSVQPPRLSSSSDGPQLPFTGFDALALGGVGLFLTGLGFTLRMLGRRARAERLVGVAPPVERPLEAILERELV